MAHDDLRDDLASIESLSKVFALSLGVLYLTGFLVVASYLSRYGVSSLSILQLQYLTTGVWVLGPPVIYAALMEVGRRFGERAVPDIARRFNWRRFIISTTLTGVPPAVFMGLLAVIPDVAAHLSWGLGVRLFLFFIAGVGCAQLAWMSLRADVASKSPWVNRTHAAPFYAGCLFIIVLGYTIWFAARIYPLIPSSLGGGRPLTISFVEGEKKMPDEIKKPDPTAKRSVAYKLLVANDRYYIVVSQSPDEQSIEINRDSVAGIVVLR
jgi:hypothetical protein